MTEKKVLRECESENGVKWKGGSKKCKEGVWSV